MSSNKRLKPNTIFMSILLLVMLALGFQLITRSILPKDNPVAVADSQEIITDENFSHQSKLTRKFEINGGDMLERDIIPQLCLVFELEEPFVKEVLALPLASVLIQDGLTDFRRMEGIIPPGSYEISEGETLEGWSKKILEVAENRYFSTQAPKDKTNSLKPAEQIILASMVEAECLANKQYTETASVFLNRLADQNRLQSCVTVEYALGFQRAYLNQDDIEIQDPYNTYQVNGLPLGPICCVDDESLRAAIQRSSDPTLYYFYYDYLLNEMFFYADYSIFALEATASRNRFISNPPVGLEEKINKQILFGE